jgi:large subunit ribosomal protein L9
MKVIMLKDVGGVGRRGTLVDVSDGFALNSLIPQKKAEQATPEKISMHEKRLQLEKAANDTRAAVVAEKLRSLDGKIVSMKGKANEKGHLFKAIKKDDVLTALSSVAGDAAQEMTLEGIPDAIKEVGEYAIRIVANGSKAVVQLVVEAA